MSDTPAAAAASLVAFLHACLDEDEQAARDAALVEISTGGHIPPRIPAGEYWSSRYHWVSRTIQAPDDQPWPIAETGASAKAVRPIAAHIARHDPARVLAEVDAKRRILAEHPWRHEPDWPSGRQCRQCATEHPCTTLRLMALPYAAHPDYRPEWVPDA